MFMRCNPMGRMPVGGVGPVSMMGAMAAPMLGGMALLAGLGPFLLGTGVGAAMVGGALLARQRMQRRDSWRDDAPITTAGMGGPDPLPGDPLPSSPTPL